MTVATGAWDPDDLAARVRRSVGILIDLDTANELASLIAQASEPMTIRVQGRDILTGLPRIGAVAIDDLRGSPS